MGAEGGETAAIGIAGVGARPGMEMGACGIGGRAGIGMGAPGIEAPGMGGRGAAGMGEGAIIGDGMGAAPGRLPGMPMLCAGCAGMSYCLSRTGRSQLEFTVSGGLVAAGTGCGAGCGTGISPQVGCQALACPDGAACAMAGAGAGAGWACSATGIFQPPPGLVASAAGEACGHPPACGVAGACGAGAAPCWFQPARGSP